MPGVLGVIEARDKRGREYTIDRLAECAVPSKLAALAETLNIQPLKKAAEALQKK